MRGGPNLADRELMHLERKYSTNLEAQGNSICSDD